MSSSIKSLVRKTTILDPRHWGLSMMGRFLCLMQEGSVYKDANLLQKYNNCALAVLFIGVNIMENHNVMNFDLLLNEMKKDLRIVLQSVFHFDEKNINGRSLLSKGLLNDFAIISEKSKI